MICSVAAHAAFGDPGFGLAAAVGQAGEFEQVAQGDVFVAVEGEGLHGFCFKCSVWRAIEAT